MTIPGSANPLLLRSAAPAAYQIERSLRFNSADSAYLSRTPASAGNRKTWTWAGWVKRSGFAAFNSLFGSYDGSTGSTYFSLIFTTSDTLRVEDISTVYRETTQVFRDPSAWYHVVLAVDTTAGTASNRVRLYVNGVEVTAFNTSNNPTPSADLGVNGTYAHGIGRPGAQAAYYFNGYLADIHFIDGQALTPSSFTEVSATTGQLIPKAYTGTFTGNSFWLKFADNSAATATTLGKDSSGLGNNFTPNNLYVSNTVYSSGVSITGSYANNTNARMAFDGSTSTKLEMSGSNNQITFTPPAAISFSSTVEVFLTPTGDVTYTRYSFNGGADTSFAAGDGWKTVASGGGTFTSLVLKQGAQSNNIGFAAIRINGSTILVDASSADNDSLTDTPTSYGTDTGAGGEVRGNYATLNPLTPAAGGTLSDGNLAFTGYSTPQGAYQIMTAVWGGRTSAIAVSSGKWYFEVTPTANAGNGVVVGVSTTPTTDQLGSTSTSYGYLNTTGEKINSNSSSSYGATWSNNDVIGCALDIDGGTVTFYKNGVSQGVAYSSLSTSTWFLGVSCRGSTTTAYANFGQRQWAYAAPAGFKALCDTSLPAPTIALPNTVMDVKLYTGNGSTQTISGLGFSPDLIWIKSRSAAYDHQLGDTVRGVTNILHSNLTALESTLNTITGTSSDGFTVSAAGFTGTNANGQTFAAWTWDAGSSTTTNNSGSISSQVRANASAGFSIVTYTGNGTNGATVGHGLSVTPSFIIVKSRSAGTSYLGGDSGSWYAAHAALGTTDNLLLNSTAAAAYRGGVGSRNSTTFTCTQHSGQVGYDSYTVQVINTTGSQYVAYCFAPVTGLSSFGSFQGNGSADGPFQWCGFRPRWILIKSSSNAEDWKLYDTARDSYNLATAKLYPNLSAAENGSSGETSSTNTIDVLSNGFKLRTSNSGTNASGATYVWAAFAESPFAYSRAR